jgi:photosystem II stability/assembly factor-like uncharacterized protein
MKKIITIYLLSFTSFLILHFVQKQHLFMYSEKPFYKISGAYKAMNFWVDQRSFPNDFIPDVGYATAFEYIKEHLQPNFPRRDRIPTWESLGPHNIGGRTLALAFNPQNTNTLFAGSASGGLWKSYSGGVGAAAWEYVPTGFPVLGVSSIAIAPTDSNLIYIGTGEVYAYQNAQGSVVLRSTRGSYGIGILKSSDGGSSWEKTLDWSYFQSRGVQVIKMNPLNPNTLWAGTTEGTYKTVDAGNSWQMVDPTIMVTDLIISHEDTSTIFIACGNFSSPGRGIYRTNDNGNSWTLLNNGLPNSYNGKAHLSMYAQNSDILYASIGNGFTSYDGATWLCRTDNGGDNWQIVSTEDYSLWQGWYSHFVGIHPNDDQVILAGGIDIWKSNTGGTNLILKSYDNWYLGLTLPGEPEGPPHYSHADHHTILYHPENPDIVYFGNDGGVFRSMDGGETFEGCNGGYQTQQFYPGFSNSSSDSSLAMGGMQDNASAIYEGTDAWRRVIGGDGSYTAINQDNNNILYGSYQYLNMRKSTNSGNNWSNLYLPGGGNTAFIAPYIVCNDNPDVIYAGKSYMLKSVNAGSNWSTMNGGQMLDGNPIVSIDVSDEFCEILYTTTAPIDSHCGVFRSFNGGENWDNITGTLPNRYPMDIVIGPDGDEILYVVMSGFGTSHLFRSEDAGDTWNDIGLGLPDVPTSAVFVDPLYPWHIYVGNDLGIFVSLDDGDSWTVLSDNLPDAVLVMDLTYSEQNRKLRAATHGNGVFEMDLIEPDEWLLGDIDFNGSVDILDIVIIVGIILGEIDPDDYFQGLGDLNADSLINIQDIILIIGLILEN